jgi:hypothetical protein
MRYAFVAASLVLACGGQVVGPDGGGSSSSSSSGGGGQNSGSGQDFPVCPADPPQAGAACSNPGQGCRYLTSGGFCEAFACTDDRKWRDAPEGC